MKTKNILHSVSSFVSIKKATGTQGTRKLIINAIKALHYDQSRWAYLCSHQKSALLRVFSTARRKDPDSQLFWESILEAVRVSNAKYHDKILQLAGDNADFFMCLLQALLNFLPRGSVYRPFIVHLLVSLADKVQFVPQSLFIEDVTMESNDVLFVSGSFGGAKQAKWKGKDIALKTPRYSIHLTDQRNSYYRLCREVLLWHQLRHPHLVEYIGILNDYKLSIIPTIVSPWMHNGTILQFVRREQGISKIKLLHQIARALNYLHRNDPPIVHQDLRCSNILINGAGDAVLGDFGLSTVNPEPYQDILFSLKGRRARWYAPELLFADNDDLRASRKTDIYAFGMVMLELFTEASPFSYIAHDATVIVDLFHGGSPRRPEVVELRGEKIELESWDKLWKIIERCWLRQPKDRPSASMLVKDLDIHLSPPKRVRNISISREEAVIDSGYSESVHYLTSSKELILITQQRQVYKVFIPSIYPFANNPTGQERFNSALPDLPPKELDGRSSLQRISTETFGVRSPEEIESLDRLRQNMVPSYSEYHTEDPDEPLLARSFSSPGASTPLSQEKRYTFDYKDLPAIPCEDNISGSESSSLQGLPTARPRKTSYGTPSNRLTQLGLSASDDHLYNYSQEVDKEDLQRQEEGFEIPVSPLPEKDYGNIHPDDSLHPESFNGLNSGSLPSIGDELPPPSETSSSSKSASIYEDQHLLNRPSIALPPYKTVSRPCYDAMFRAFPDFVASLERMHGVSLVFQFGRNLDGKHVVEIHVSTSGVLPDVLSAQWEIEKIIEFHDLFCAS